MKLRSLVEFGGLIEENLTVTTASRVAREMMSAQETIPGQASSTAALAVSIRSIPCSVRLGSASSSAALVGVLFIRFDASQPCNISAGTPC